MLSTAMAQQSPKNYRILNVTGTVMGTDSVGNIISIRTDDQKQMVFSVPEKAIITQQTHTIGLMDIGKSDSVTIQYFVLPPAKNAVVSIIDNESIVNE